MQKTSPVSLKEFNSFGVDATASGMLLVENENDLGEIAEILLNHQYLILGDGTNTLFSSDFDGWIVKMAIKGVSYEEEGEAEVKVRVGAGENWHDFVLDSLDKGYQGLENLSLIPGSVGAAPIQNIGAYGVEVSGMIESVEAFDLKELEYRTLGNEECGFGYRTSVFKKSLRDRLLVTRVNFRLNKNWSQLNTSYRSLSFYLEDNRITELSPKVISEAVIAIRNSKLPDPRVIGNAGSFFKNPVVEQEKYQALKRSFPEIEAFQQKDGKVKVFAGWLIEHLGWKGRTFGSAAVHSKQALVLVNTGNATGAQIKSLAFKLIEEVKDKFGIELEPEVRIV